MRALQRRNLSYLAKRPVIGGAKPSHNSTERQALCEQRRGLPHFANEPVIGGAELLHHTQNIKLCVSTEEVYVC